MMSISCTIENNLQKQHPFYLCESRTCFQILGLQDLIQLFYNKPKIMMKQIANDCEYLCKIMFSSVSFLTSLPQSPAIWAPFKYSSINYILKHASNNLPNEWPIRWNVSSESPCLNSPTKVFAKIFASLNYKIVSKMMIVALIKSK